MHLDDLPRGTRCFVDANVFYYYFVNDPAFSVPVNAFFRRLASGEYVAASSVFVAADALHRVMLSEIQARFSPGKALAYVQRHPQVISQLRAYPLAVKTLRNLPLEMLPTAPTLLPGLADLVRTCSLLTNDALIVAVMKQHGILDLVSNDDDFDAIPGITVWKPRGPFFSPKEPSP